MSLLLHYKMNDNTADKVVVDSKSGFTGTSAVNTEDMSVEGKNDTALYFDGTTDAVAISYDPVMSMTANISIAFWIKKDGNSTGRDYIIAKRFGGLSPNNYNLEINNNKLEFWSYTTGWNGYQSADVIIDGVWEHWAMTFDSSDKVQFYRNGQLETTNNIGGSLKPMTPDTNDLYIGQASDGTNGIKGALDDMQVYNTTLTPEEVEEIYNTTIPAIPRDELMGGFGDTKIGKAVAGTNKTAGFRDEDS